MNQDVPLLEQQQENVRAAWEAVVLCGEEPSATMRQAVRSEILLSWVECRALGISPTDTLPSPQLSPSELAHLQQQNTVLLDAANTTLNVIAAAIARTGYILTLSDAQGYVLTVNANSQALQKAKVTWYLPGCLRTNQSAGTNAIGLCLQYKDPVHLMGAEHYRQFTHDWTCASAPVKDSSGQLLGIITLSGPMEDSQTHTLPLVIYAAHAIESSWREKNLITTKDRLNILLGRMFDSLSDGIIAITQDLLITHSNNTAKRMFDLGDEGGIGKKILDIFMPDNQLLTAIRKQQALSMREVMLKTQNSSHRLFCTVEPLPDSVGMLLRFLEKDQMVTLAKRFGGNIARYKFNDIVGQSQVLLTQIEIAQKTACTDSRILISGESGTGKEVFAQAIHNASRRSNEPFVAISCGAIPQELIESEMFGYVAGAFTGAKREGMVGKCELANNGTLFLDEVDGMPLAMQIKMLRFLQQREITRLGDTRTIPLNIRVIAATNKNLSEEVRQSNFREDLYFRLNVIDLHLPPLRERLEDLGLLCKYIINKKCGHRENPPQLSPEALHLFYSYHWPGNIRELENSLERAMSLCSNNLILPEHLPAHILNLHAQIKKPSSAIAKPTTEYLNRHSTRVRNIPIGEIQEALEKCRGNISYAAKTLRVSRSTLYRQLKKFGLAIPEIE